jgi:hypothetical protein
MFIFIGYRVPIKIYYSYSISKKRSKGGSNSEISLIWKVYNLCFSSSFDVAFYRELLEYVDGKGIKSAQKCLSKIVIYESVKKITNFI